MNRRTHGKPSGEVTRDSRTYPRYSCQKLASTGHWARISEFQDYVESFAFFSFFIRSFDRPWNLPHCRIINRTMGSALVPGCNATCLIKFTQYPSRKDQGRSVESFRKAASFARISKCIPVMRNLSKGNLDGVSPPLHSSFEIRRFNGRELSSRFFETWKRQGHRKFLSNYATYFFADLTNTLVWSGTRIALSNKIPVVMRNTLIRVSVSLTFMTNRLFAWQTNFPVRRTFLPETV